MDYEIICLEKIKGKDWSALGRRFLALLLACVLTFTSVPFTAFTEEMDTELLVEVSQEDVSVLPETEDPELVTAWEYIDETPDLPEDGEELVSNETKELPEQEEPVQTSEEAEETETDNNAEDAEPAEEESESSETEEEPEQESDGTEEPAEEADETETDEDETEGVPEREIWDITLDQERLKLELNGWWYGSSEDLLQIDDPHYVDYSGVELEPELRAPAGVSMHFRAENVKIDEYFTVRLPAQMQDIYFDRPAEVSGAVCFVLPVEDPYDDDYGCTDVKVAFYEDGTFEGTLFLGFTLAGEWSYSICLREETEEYYWVALPMEIRAAAANEDPATGEIWNKKVSVSVKEIVFVSQKEGGEDWEKNLKPTVFSDQNIKLTAHYEDGKEKTYDVQQAVSSEPFYLKFVHDGAGGGSFEIRNVPNYKIEDKTAKVVYYELFTDTVDFPAYQCEHIRLDMFDAQNEPVSTISIPDMELTLENTQKIILQPNVNEGADAADFQYVVTFTDTHEEGKEAREIQKDYTVHSGETRVIEVPIGMNYAIKQVPLDGYRFSGSYTVTTIPKEGAQTETTVPKADDEPVEGEIIVTGTVTAGVDIQVSSTNYSQNVRKEFRIDWVDDDVISARPKLSGSDFKLQYQVPVEKDGVTVLEWVDLTAANMAELGLGKLPEFDDSKKTEGVYAFTGLPSTDADGNPVTFRVQMAEDELAGVKKTYSAAEVFGEDKENPTGFVLSETMIFDATISWVDKDPDTTRPDIDQVNQNGGMTIKLYRRVKGGANTEVLLDAEDWADFLTGSGSSWNIQIPNLPRYDEEGREYDYAIKADKLDEYKAYYSNPRGIYASDTEYCHKGGNILEKIDTHTSFTGSTTYEPFSARKKWNDDTDENRGSPTVTLWRYSDNGTTETSSIDAAFAANKAAPVVYHYQVSPEVKDDEGNVVTPAVYKDVVLSYQLDGTKADANGWQTITFDDSTVDVPSTYRLPRYDEQGREYVYFVRETMDSENYAQQFAREVEDPESDEPKYVAGSQSGASFNEIISNTRREKAAVNVTVEWKAPANLADLNPDTAVRVQIVDKDGKELTVYSPTVGSYAELSGEAKDAALTVDGFNENIALLDLTFYVDIFDEFGRTIDMTQAVIKEITIIRDNTEIPVTYSEGSNEGHFTLGEDEFKSNSQYTGDTVNGGIKEFSYKLTNTITGTRDYTLIKKWDSSIPSELYEDVKYVTFTLTRTSSDASDVNGEKKAVFEISTDFNFANIGVSDPVVTAAEGQTSWTKLLENLPKYDDDGYAYLYEATEAKLIKENGEVKSRSDIMVENRVMAVHHYRTEDQTTALNYISSPGSPVIWISKNWVDNGDSAAHGPVAVRVYRKADVRKQLEESGLTNSTDVTNLDWLTGPFFSLQLSANNNWTQDIYLDPVEKEMGTKGWTEGVQNVRDYLVVEYKVAYEPTGSLTAALPSQFTYAELYQMTSPQAYYHGTGTVKNSDRQYRTETSVRVDANNNPTPSYVDITNTRIGQVTLRIEKSWHDEGSNRPNVTFTIQRDGQPLAGSEGTKTVVQSGGGSEITILPGSLDAYLSSTGTITVATSDEPQQDSDDQNGSGTTQPPVAQSEDGNGDAAPAEQPATVVILKDLPMFSEYGVPYTYNIVEGSVENYISEKGTTTAVAWYENIPDNTLYTFPYTNTKTGSTVHVAYKKWNDIASEGDDRPDLAFTLWQYLLTDKDDKTKWVKYTDKDPVMVPVKNAGGGEGTDAQDLGPSYTPPENEQQYDWKVVIDGLPAYNSDGQSYGYSFEETMNSKSNGYAAYEPSYEKQDDQVDIYTNTLVGTTTFSGDKVWANLDDYQIETSDLPSPKMLLFRSTTPVTLTQEIVDQVKNETYSGDLIQILTSSLNPAKDSYLFPAADMSAEDIAAAVSSGYLVAETTENGETVYKLPRFDANGAHYYYTVWEQLDSAIAEQLYTKLSESGTMTNTFRDDVNRRKIRVTKEWGGRQYLKGNHDVYPTVTYTLYRYLKGEVPQLYIPEEGDPAIKKIAVKTISPAEFKQSTDGKASAIFDNLLIYSPAGKPYGYFVVESEINGYSTDYTDEEGSASLTAFSDVTSIPDNALSYSEDDVPLSDVQTKNTYDKSGNINIQGAKKWDDYGNIAALSGTRPESVALTLRRYTTGARDNVQSTVLTLSPASGHTTRTDADKESNNYYIVWTNTTSNNWSYTIYDLEKYAPNGETYIYVVSEKTDSDTIRDTGYQPTNGEVKVTVDGNAQNGEYLTSDNGRELENRYSGSYTVRKNWLDGNNAYDLRPKSIDVALQRRVKAADGTDGEWQYILWNDAYSTHLSSVKLADNRVVVGMTITPAHVVENTKDNSWEYKFENLPGKVKQGDAVVDVEYRVIETKIGTEYLKMTGDIQSAGSYIYDLQSWTQTRSTLHNTLDATKLLVKKEWQEDQENAYYSRPASLKFTLQMRGYVVSETNPNEVVWQGDDWINVKVNGKEYFELSAANNWTRLLEDLPTAFYYEKKDEQGEVVSGTYYAVQFRAVEKTTKDRNQEIGPYPIDGAQNYIDNTSYAVQSQNHVRDPQQSTSTIENGLIILGDISVEKTWHRDSGSEKKAVFRLQNRVQGTKEWQDFKDAISGETKLIEKTLTSTQSGTQTFTWRNLPKNNLLGEPLEYRVVEYAIDGYATIATDSSKALSTDTIGATKVYAVEPETEEVTGTDGKTRYNETYSFTNIELQNYKVEKTWINADYAQKENGYFTSTFLLEQQFDGDAADAWTTVVFTDASVSAETVLSTQAANDSAAKNEALSHIWYKLPKYAQKTVTTDAGTVTEWKPVIYRARETSINGQPVNGDTNGSYIVTYTYDGTGSPEHAGTVTQATNRMVYGFVNLQKTAAYLKPGIDTAYGTETRYLEGVTFDILDSSRNTYVSGVKTDADGYLLPNEDGTYGREKKFLIAGTYQLKETNTNDDFIAWKDTAQFTVGVTGGDTDTGEHGTAWISTNADMTLYSQYLHPTDSATHSASCGCVKPLTEESTPAYNIESRGILEFTKMAGENPVDSHDNATGESKVWFGVYVKNGETEELVAYMAGAQNDGSKMVLTTQSPEGDTVGTVLNSNGIPYLRTDAPLSLLSGSYIVKELVPPAGFKLDETQRTAKIEKLDVTKAYDNLAETYQENVGKFTDTKGDNSWQNEENVVTLYKLDQYGRPVTLKENDYLLLEAKDTSFLTGQSAIWLMQDAQSPWSLVPPTEGETDAQDDSTAAEPKIRFDAANQRWIITGLFDAGKTYTISEPDDSVPENYVQAKPITFTMGTDGKITVTADNTNAEVSNPLSARGDDEKNYYSASKDGNVIVLRDPARYRKNVVLEKVDETTGAGIANIAFGLYTDVVKDGKTEKTPILPADVYLVTDQYGKINLASADTIYVKKSGSTFTVTNAAADKTNRFTECELKYGLDIGDYYFEEIEYGKSDIYRLLENPVNFRIDPVNSTPPPTDPEDYAIVTYDTTNSRVSQTDNTGTVKNTPVANKLSLNLTKVDKANEETKLSGAVFTLTYTSINHNQTGAQTDSAKQTIVYDCKTDSNGVLRLVNANGELAGQPDISKKGDYVLTETKAPNYFMTRTQSGTTTPITLLTFSVNSNNEIVNVNTVTGTQDLAGTPVVTPHEGTICLSLDVTAENEKTIVSVAKLNDILKTNATKTRNQQNLGGEPLTGAKLEIWEQGKADAPVWQNYNDVDSTKDQTGLSSWTLTDGTLKENTVYKLKEVEPPVGFMEATPILFKIFGTTEQDGKIISQLYVYTGSESYPNAESQGWSMVQNILNNRLTVVDEAIIAPVDLQKKVGTEILPDALFAVKSLDASGTVLGTAKTDANGYLRWETIEADALALGLIYDAAGKRINSDTGMKGTAIILRQNTSGYEFTETYAPDHAYNSGGSYQVVITAQNYLDYKTATGYNTGKFVDIMAANRTDTKTAVLGSTSIGLVNPPYRSTVTLHKYDADEEASLKPIPGAEFTLCRIEDGKETAYGKAWYTGGEEAVTDDVFTTDEDGNLSITIPEKGTYILKETAPAEGYARNSDDFEKASFMFTLSDETKSEPYGHEGTAILKNDDDDNGVPNTRIMGSVTLTKQDAETEELLNDVAYTLTRKNTYTDTSVSPEFLLHDSETVYTGHLYEAVYDEDTKEWSLVEKEGEGTSGVLEVTGLNWGQYELKELKELSGYIYSSEVHEFTVSPDARDQVIGTGTPKVVTNEKNEVTFHKIRDTVNGIFEQKDTLKGAEFVVHIGENCAEDEECELASFYLSRDDKVGETVQKAVSGANGTVTIYGLPTTPADSVPSSANPGKTTYHLVETKAPKGYILQTDPIPFTIDRFGHVEIEGKSASEVTMKNVPIQIYIGKIGESAQDILSGAVFTLEDVCTDNDECDGTLADEEKTLETLTIANAGDIMIPIETVISGHTYKLTETTAPDGYKCNAVVTFTVNTDGTVTLGEPSGGYNGPDAKIENAAVATAALDENKTHIRISNEKIRLSLVKQDYDTESVKLKDVEFTLVPASGSEFAALEDTTGYTTAPQTFTTGADGVIDFPDGLLKCGNTYLLTETENPYASYRFAKEENRQVTITVDSAGEIHFTAAATDMFELNETKEMESHTVPNIVAKNEKIKLTIVKVDQATGVPLSDVTLQLTKLGENGTETPVVLTGVSSADGKWVTSGTCSVTFQANEETEFTSGTYVLKETGVPNYYNSIFGPLTVTIDASGVVTTASTTRGETTHEVPVNGQRVQNFSITNPTDGKHGEITLNVTNAHNSKLQITKRGIGGTEQVLAGVVFKLDPVDGTSDSATATTGENGIARFTNLPDGTYRLTELKTAAGYNLLSAPLTIEIDRNGEVYKVDGQTGSLSRLKGENEDHNTLAMEVFNRKGLVLPATGAVTPQLPKAILGITAFLEGLVLFLYQRSTKRKRREAEY